MAQMDSRLSRDSSTAHLWITSGLGKTINIAETQIIKEKAAQFLAPPSVNSQGGPAALASTRSVKAWACCSRDQRMSSATKALASSDAGERRSAFYASAFAIPVPELRFTIRNRSSDEGRSGRSEASFQAAFISSLSEMQSH